MPTREIYAFPTTLSILRKYTQKALCTKTPLSRGVTGKTFTDTENNKIEKSTHFPTGIAIRQPSNNKVWYHITKLYLLKSCVHVLAGKRSLCSSTNLACYLIHFHFSCLKHDIKPFYYICTEIYTRKRIEIKIVSLL